jgi:type II secretion system protein G
MVNGIINRPLFKEETMKRKGFTLIELMVVVVIIGILAAIAIPNFMRMQQRAKEGSVKNNGHTLQLAVEDFATLNAGAYPSDYADVTSETGESLLQLLPGAVHPVNPFTGLATVPAASYQNADPKGAGFTADLGIGIYQLGSDASLPATPDAQRYAIHMGNATAGDGANLNLVLSNY